MPPGASPVGGILHTLGSPDTQKLPMELNIAQYPVVSAQHGEVCISTPSALAHHGLQLHSHKQLYSGTGIPVPGPPSLSIAAQDIDPRKVAGAWHSSSLQPVLTAPRPPVPSQSSCQSSLSPQARDSTASGAALPAPGHCHTRKKNSCLPMDFSVCFLY